MFITVIIVLISIMNAIYTIALFYDSFLRRDELKEEKGHPLFLALYTCFAQFIGTFGFSDFAISVVVYRKLKLVEDLKLPGTLNTACTVPVAVMAFAYTSSVEVDHLTMVVCVIAQVFGGIIGSKYVVRLNENKLRLCMSIALLGVLFFMLAGKFGFISNGGDAIGLTPLKLIIAAILIFIFGALNIFGLGSFAPTMATLYALGLNPAVAFPLMMVATAFALPVGSIKFIKTGLYGMKIALFSTIFGVLGVLIAVYVVKGLNSSLLKWIMILVITYTSVSMLWQEYKAKLLVRH